MTKLAGPLQMTGRLGNLTMYKDHKGDIIVRQAVGPKAQQLEEGENYLNFRRSRAEFIRASKAGKVIRQAMAMSTIFCREGSDCSRLTKLLKKMVLTDTVSTWGEKNVSNGNPEMLEGFQWNEQLELEAALKADVAGFIDPASGKAHIVIESFVPARSIHRPGGATHFQILCGGASLHPEKEEHKVQHEESAIHEIGSKKKIRQDFNLQLETKGFTLLMLGAGVRYYEQVNGELLSLHRGAFAVVKAVRTEG